ncbi:MAG TPA: ABC transporter ATP-binding protein [Candidatus Bipolaricaulis anaerobius]|uniref:Leucine/isoleucine/valine transporter subunit ATP-binding component of ABC superfamily n=1 Tax=Candidatus Bipolaricaulis anaerobius TaxID=2026885 RepID=A0A2X3L2R3_9BACT|nr:ABC transporter ATP-binding protein [Candidatus Bipolaricaulis anaerobius]MBP7726033.1 ABC transporter ATP-binding protein [Candidatus Bipolaricaulis sp.]MDD5763631.1 ABC transporter ATP-binding protein [Candidatus Bipolaricaulis anaerobius]SQD93110.1 leucine/isoleucine/valine transporter subunit; ATP-binding component of ABC superfamily [Candidatus Bipolaricaulis anaerobius]HNR24360.1 ABC transporter ATP-binding protein [Candidatus Bipolaricaulis anaerobius]HNS23557.1 ABC transporter ATP-b
MLNVSDVDHYYGKAHVLRNLSLSVGAESVGVFGPNGAGKTTLVNAITGFVRPRRGEIVFDGTPLLRLQPHQITRLGIAMVPQERELFPFMSVYGNLESGAAYVPGARERMRESLDAVFQLFPILQERTRQLAVTLSGGEQRMLAIARALMSAPKLLILDEPSLGLQPSLVTDVFHTLRDVSQRISIFLAEQNVRQSLKAIDRGYIIENGQVVLEGPSDELLDNEHVKRAYLGL